MELLFVLIAAAGVGTIARYALPGRQSYGVLLLPAIGVGVSAVTWSILTWLGFPFDGGWIWVFTLALAALGSAAVGWMLPRRRRESDERTLAAAAR